MVVMRHNEGEVAANCRAGPQGGGQLLHGEDDQSELRERLLGRVTGARRSRYRRFEYRPGTWNRIRSDTRASGCG